MSRKITEIYVNRACETLHPSQLTRNKITVNVSNKDYILMEFDLECTIPDCQGDSCRPDKTQIAKIKRVRTIVITILIT